MGKVGLILPPQSMIWLESSVLPGWWPSAHFAVYWTSKKINKSHEHHSVLHRNQTYRDKVGGRHYLRAFSFSLHCCSSFRILCLSPLITLTKRISFSCYKHILKITFIPGMFTNPLDILTTLPSLFLSTKLRVYSDPYRKNIAQLGFFFSIILVSLTKKRHTKK